MTLGNKKRILRAVYVLSTLALMVFSAQLFASVESNIGLIEIKKEALSALDVFEAQANADFRHEVDAFPIISDRPDIYAEYADGTIVTAVFNGKGDSISKEDYANYMTQSSQYQLQIFESKLQKIEAARKRIEEASTSEEISQAGTPIQWYIEGGGSTALTSIPSEKKRISAVDLNTTGSPATRSLKLAGSIKVTANFALSFQDVQAVFSAKGFSIDLSITVDDTRTISIPNGQYGWFDVIPLKKHTWGTMYYGITTDLPPYQVTTGNKYLDVWYTTGKEMDVIIQSLCSPNYPTY